MSDFLKRVAQNLDSETVQFNQLILNAGETFLKNFNEATNIIKREERNLEFTGREEYSTFWSSGHWRDVILRHSIKEENTGSIKDFRSGANYYFSLKCSILVFRDSKYGGKKYTHEEKKFSIELMAHATRDESTYGQVDLKSSPEKAWRLSLYPVLNRDGDGYTSKHIDAAMSGEDSARLFFENILKNSGCRIK